MRNVLVKHFFGKSSLGNFLALWKFARLIFSRVIPTRSNREEPLFCFARVRAFPAAPAFAFGFMSVIPFRSDRKQTPDQVFLSEFLFTFFLSAARSPNLLHSSP
jgi:hypothetical protein